MQRRQFIQSGLAGFVLLSAPPALVFGKPRSPAKKLIWVMLRGAMDGIHAVIPVSDPHLNQHREALLKPIANDLLPLDRHFSLHPALTHMHALFKQKQCAPIVAVASGYRARSHFDGQDQMESGLNQTAHENGWLARVVEVSQGEGLAVSMSIPLALRGTNKSQNWYPSQFRQASSDTLERLALLYQDKPVFSKWLNDALESQDMLGEADQRGRPGAKFSELAAKCGLILSHDNSANCAMLEMGGWDTHNAQNARLNRQFTELDKGLAALQENLADAWQNSLVIVTTEFGRTVAVNGTAGTDHGTGSAMFALGGAIDGGKVLGQWPGLTPENLYERRDLMPTSDVRAWTGKLLSQHMGLSQSQVAHVFPDTNLMI